MYKSERREIQRRNRRKMKVEGKSVFVIRDAQRKRDMQFAKARRKKQLSPITV